MVAAATGGEAPFWSLLSQALVAFTIEFDNEAEHRLPHRTTALMRAGAKAAGPWLVSMAMWSNSLRHLPPKGLALGELERRARARTNLAGMVRWGYLAVEPGPSGGSAERPRPDALVRPTRAGLKAQAVWAPLEGEIEDRWRERFGAEPVARLRGTLLAIAERLDFDPPDSLPILGYGLFSRPLDGVTKPSMTEDDAGPCSLPALLARVLLAFAVEFERDGPLSLAIGANLLRVLSASGQRLRDLPRLTGVSKASIDMALVILTKARLAVVEADVEAARQRRVRLTPEGQAAQQACLRRMAEVEAAWSARFGAAAIDGLLAAALAIAGPSGATSPLFAGLTPYSDGWRAATPAPEVLPHYPMVLHRGGFPDGS